MSVTLKHFLKIALRMPIRLAIVRTLKKIGCNFLWVQKLDFKLSPDFMRPSKSSKILLENMDNINIGLTQLNDIIPNSTVLEIGCGRYLGLAPLTICLGAQRYIGVDPSFERVAINLDKTSTEFLTKTLKETELILSNAELTAGQPQPLKNKIEMEEFFEKSSFVRLKIDQIQLDSKIDVCFSISCLEHIQNFSQACDTLAKLSNPNTIHYHIVNFSNHISKKQPFGELYESSYEVFAKKWNNNINGLRVTDMLRLFENANIKVRSITVSKDLEMLPSRIDNYWTSKYNKDVLATRVAVITNL